MAEKSNWIHTEVKDFLSEIFLRPNDLAEMVDQLDAAHKEGFQCRSQGCLAVFPLHSSRGQVSVRISLVSKCSNFTYRQRKSTCAKNLSF